MKSSVSPDSPRPSRSSETTPPRADNGFTLMELLVVLVIVALISSILMAAFSRVLDVRERLATFLDGAEAPVLVGDWFRDTVGGLVPDAPAGDGHFTGTAHRLTGLSLAPLDGPPGVPAVITWEVVFDPEAERTHLRYHEGDRRTLDIASWPGDQGGLRYCDANFACRGNWPRDDKASELPPLIWLDAVKGVTPWPILAAPRADLTPLSINADLVKRRSP